MVIAVVALVMVALVLVVAVLALLRGVDRPANSLPDADEVAMWREIREALRRSNDGA
jgi:hypothetical protein